MVEGFYTWGGQLRTTDTGPGGTGLAHCRPEFIPAEAEHIFTALHRTDYLRGREADEFSAGLAWVWGEQGIEALLRPALLDAETVKRRDELRQEMAEVNQRFFAPRPTRSPRLLDAELTTAV